MQTEENTVRLCWLSDNSGIAVVLRLYDWSHSLPGFFTVCDRAEHQSEGGRVIEVFIGLIMHPCSRKTPNSES